MFEAPEEETREQPLEGQSWRNPSVKQLLILLNLMVFAALLQVSCVACKVNTAVDHMR